jgi:hypothetical protein
MVVLATTVTDILCDRCFNTAGKLLEGWIFLSRQKIMKNQSNRIESNHVKKYPMDKNEGIIRECLSETRKTDFESKESSHKIRTKYVKSVLRSASTGDPCWFHRAVCDGVDLPLLH